MSYTGSTPDTPRAADWRDTAACYGEDPDLFFPVGASEATKSQERHAKTICWRCPSLHACGLWALDTRQPIGVWGGMTAGERRAILRRRGIRLPDPDAPEGPDTLAELWAERTAPLDGGHLAWTAGTPMSYRGRNYTPQRIGFRLDRGREPVGIVRRTCLVQGCVLPAHLADQVDRDAARQAVSA